MSARAMSNSKTLQDVVFAIHFVGSPMTIPDFASWIETFKEPGLDLHQAPPLQTIHWQPDGTPPGISLNVGGFSLPRVFLRSDAVNEYYLLQEDRFAFGWHRHDPVGVDGAYPGYEALRDRWAQVLDKFDDWRRSRPGSIFSYRIVELSYQNALPLTEADANRRVPKYFRLSNFGGRQIREFQLAWRENVSDPEVGYVDALATLGTAPPATTVFQFNFTGIAPLTIHASNIPGARGLISNSVGLVARSPMSVCDAIHRRISDIYSAAINESEL